jgi:hypothetical protein
MKSIAVYVRSHRGFVLRVGHDRDYGEYNAVIRGPNPDNPGRPIVITSYYTDDLADAIATGELELAAALRIPELELDLADDLAARASIAP